MKNKAHLHFLLALGNQKVVILKHSDKLHVYATPVAATKSVSLYHLSDTLSVRN